MITKKHRMADLSNEITINQPTLEMQKPRTVAKANKEFIPDPYKKVAKGMEKQFLQFMISQMKNSIGKEKQDSSASAYYKGLLEQERSDIMATSKGGLGIQDLILDQIYPRRMRSELAHNQYLKQANKYNQNSILKRNNEDNLEKAISKIELNKGNSNE